MATKVAKDAALRGWWRNLRGEELTLFYKKQKGREKRGRGRNWDFSQFEQYVAAEQGNRQLTRTRLIPRWEWLHIQKTTRPSATIEELDVEWTQLLATPSTQAEKHGGEWLVPVFAGVIRDVVAAQMTGCKQARSVHVQSAEQFSTCAEEGAQLLQQAAASAASNVSNTFIMQQGLNLEPIRDREVAPGPPVPVHVPVLLELMKRDIATRAVEQDAMDEELLKDLHMQAKAAAGKAKDAKRRGEGAAKINLIRVTAALKRMYANMQTNLESLQERYRQAKGYAAEHVKEDVTGEADQQRNTELQAATQQALDALEGRVKLYKQTFVDVPIPEADADRLATQAKTEDAAIRKGPMADVRTALKTYNKFSDSYMRVKRKMAKAASEAMQAAGLLVKEPEPPASAQAAPVLPPVCSGALQATAGGKSFNTATMVGQEFWDNLKCVRLASEEITELTKKIIATEHWEKHQEWLTKYCNDSNTKHCTTKIEKPSVARTFDDLLRATLPPDVFLRLSFPASAKRWCSSIFDTQVYQMQAGYHATALPQYCIREVRLVCTGGPEILVGIPVSELDGERLPQRLEYFSKLSKPELDEWLAAGKAWCVSVTAGQLLCVPMNCAVVSFLAPGAQKSAGLRWGLLNPKQPEELDDVDIMLQVMLEAYPVLAKTDFKDWSAFLSLTASVK